MHSSTETTPAHSAPGAPTTVQRVSTEALGTFLLVLVGCGAYTLTEDVVATAIAFGLAYAVAVHAFRRASADLNPAVSAGAAVAGRISWKEAGLRAAAQLVGAILGALVLFALMHGYEGFDAEGSLGRNAYGDEGSGYAAWAALLLELVLTFLLVLVVLAVTDRREDRDDDRAVGPLVTGLAVLALMLVALPATGGSLNPARSIGPALFAGGDAIIQLWVFILGPLLGGLLAGAAYPFLLGRDGDRVPGSGVRIARPAPKATQQDSTTTQDWSQQQPIIQDGWQWDPVAQEWKPAEQGWPPAGGTHQS